MECSYCRKEFSENEGEKSCGGCSLISGCKKVKCPHCGYEMPQTASFLKLLANWRGSRGSRPSGTVTTKRALTLNQLKAGQQATVLSLNGISDHDRNKLMALGIMPGTDLHLVQKYPSYVVALGFTQLALDRETALHIEVQPPL